MRKKSKIYLASAIGSLIVITGISIWILTVPFEGEKPTIEIQPLKEFLSKPEQFSVAASDMKSGLGGLKVSIRQNAREVVVFEKNFKVEGSFFRKGPKHFDSAFSIDPEELKLKQGAVALQAHIWDCSKRNAGKGNQSIFQHKMIVDTVPPSIRPVSKLHYVNVGGAGLVVYQPASDAIESGLFVDGLFFKGFPVQDGTQDGYYVCYFAIPYDVQKNPELYLTAKDEAGNQSKVGFNYHIRRKKFRIERSVITGKFLKHILPYFSFYRFAADDSDIEKFIKINDDLRKEDRLTYLKLGKETSPDRLWEGAFLRHKNAVTTARFAERRIYYYEGKKIDEQVHLGIDLASVANAKVEAANTGRVIFADRLGIYGLTVVLDHGQSIFSTYSHLSKKHVEVGQNVKKGDVIGLTGQTGLAGGDHLHFGMMVGGVFVNPIEWWDPHWIRDNVTMKFAMIKR